MGTNQRAVMSKAAQAAQARPVSLRVVRLRGDALTHALKALLETRHTSQYEERELRETLAEAGFEILKFDFSTSENRRHFNVMATRE